MKVSELENLKPGLVNVGYKYISTMRNIKSTMFTMFIITKVLLILSSIILYFAKTKTRCKPLRLKHTSTSLLHHLSTPSFFSFHIPSSILLLTSAFIYLKNAKSYSSETVILGGTVLWEKDAFLAILCVVSAFYGFLCVFVEAGRREWWGLGGRLRVGRG